MNDIIYFVFAWYSNRKRKGWKLRAYRFPRVFHTNTYSSMSWPQFTFLPILIIFKNLFYLFIISGSCWPMTRIQTQHIDPGTFRGIHIPEQVLKESFFLGLGRPSSAMVGVIDRGHPLACCSNDKPGGSCGWMAGVSGRHFNDRWVWHERK